MRSTKMTTRLCICALTLIGCVLLAIAAPAQQPRRDLSPTAWNEFVTASFAPTAEEVKQFKSTASTADREIAFKHIGRVLRPELAPPVLKDNLLPLKGWHDQNVFVARMCVGQNLVQVTEREGRVTVEIRRADGSPLVEPKTDLATYVLETAKEWLCDTMQPTSDFNIIDPPKASKVATWITGDEPDSEGFRLQVNEAYTDGSFLRYEVQGFQTTSKRVFPAPYTFGAAQH